MDIDLKGLSGDRIRDVLETKMNDHLATIACEVHGQVPRVSLAGDVWNRTLRIEGRACCDAAEQIAREKLGEVATEIVRALGIDRLS